MVRLAVNPFLENSLTGQKLVMTSHNRSLLGHHHIEGNKFILIKLSNHYNILQSNYNIEMQARCCCGAEHGGKGLPPSRRVYVEGNTTGEGFPPLAVSCVKGNTTGEGFPPLAVSCVKRNTARRGPPPHVA